MRPKSATPSSPNSIDRAPAGRGSEPGCPGLPVGVCVPPPDHVPVAVPGGDPAVLISRARHDLRTSSSRTTGRPGMRRKRRSFVGLKDLLWLQPPTRAQGHSVAQATALSCPIGGPPFIPIRLQERFQLTKLQPQLGRQFRAAQQVLSITGRLFEQSRQVDHGITRR